MASCFVARGQGAQELGERVVTPLHRGPVEQRRPRPGRRLLAGVDHERSAAEGHQRGPGPRPGLGRGEAHDPELVVVLDEPELRVVRRQGGVLPAQHLQVAPDGLPAGDDRLPDRPQVVGVLDVERGEHLRVRPRGQPVGPAVRDPRGVRRLRQPDQARADLGELGAGLRSRSRRAPARRRRSGTRPRRGPAHSARVSIRYRVRSRLGCLRSMMSVHAGTVVIGSTVVVLVEELRMLLDEDAVGRGVVEDHVDHHLEAGCVGGRDEGVEVGLRAQLGVERAVVADRVGAPRRPCVRRRRSGGSA